MQFSWSQDCILGRRSSYCMKSVPDVHEIGFMNNLLRLSWRYHVSGGYLFVLRIEVG